MKHLISAVIALAVAVLAVLPAAAWPNSTIIVKYNAAAMKGKAVNGSCWTSSIASTRSDAFRCMIGNTIMDPCFKVSNKVVNCPQDLAAKTGVVINLTKPLPQANTKSASKPWRFQFAGGSGIMCNAGTGTVIGNYPYYCDGNFVCTVPVASKKWPTTYVATCGTPNGPMTVKGARPMFLMTIWQ